MTPISSAEIEQFRADTPGTQKRIHFNNAGTSLPPEQVVKPVLKYLQEESRMGGYEIEEFYLDQMNETYSLGAKYLNCSPEEIAYSSSNTLAWRTAFNGLRFSPGDEILTSVPEYGSNSLAYLQQQSENGVKVKIVPNDEAGQMSITALASMVNEKTKLISISHIPSTTGLVQDAEAVGKIAKAANVLYMIDACQSGGQIPLDVEKLNCDVLSLTGRKYMRGPRGTGLLYVKKSVQDQIQPPFLDIRSGNHTPDGNFEVLPTARRFETFEHNRALQIGLNESMRYAMEVGIDRIWERVQILGKRFREGLSQINGVTVLDRGNVQGGIVTYLREGFDNLAEKRRLFDRGINVSISPQGSAYQYMTGLGLTSAMRASVHYYNTEAEVDRFLEALKG